MARDTLIDVFQEFVEARGEFLVYDDGFRSRAFTYADVGRAARGFAARLHEAGLRKGDKVVFFSENRPEWIAAFWGCLLCGVVIVPIDYRSSPDFLARVSRIVAAKLVLIGQDVPALAGTPGAPVWLLQEMGWRDGSPPAVALTRDDVAEIIFTSGATAEPKGVIITHRNVLANIVPVEREVLKYRKWGRPFYPLRFLNLLPLSHMFGQAMATFIPPMLPGVVIFMRGYNPAEIVSQIKRRRVSVLVCVPKILDVLREHALRVAPEAAPPPPHRPPGAPAKGRRQGLECSRAQVRRSEGACRAALVAIPPPAPDLWPEILGVHRRRRSARPRARGVLGRARVRRDPGIWPHRNGAHRQPQSPVRHQEGLGREGDGGRGRHRSRPTARFSSAAKT